MNNGPPEHLMVCLLVANLDAIDPDPRPRYVEQELPGNWIFDQYYFDEQNFPQRPGAITPRMQAKIPKMLGWDMVPPYDYYIWLDSSFRISDPGCVQWFIGNCLNHDMVLFRHPKRQSIASELCYMQRKMRQGDPYILMRYGEEPCEAQVQRYLADPDFRDGALYAGGAFCYAANLVARPDNAMKEWFHQTVTGSIQDQLSLPWVLNKYGVKLNVLSEGIFQNRFIEFMGTH
jgi:hypothetical protein